MQRDLETIQVLEKILSVLKLANAEAIRDEKEAILKGAAKRKVYELCDGKNTVNEIATKSELSQPNVSQHLSSLLESGLVLYNEVGGKKYYFKSLE